MPTIRLRSQLGAGAVRALDAYVRSADKAAAVHMSDAILSPRSAADEMAVLARMGRTRFPLWHFVLSWPAHDPIDTTTGLETAAQLVRALDLDGTQWIAAAHGDAAHRHVHLIVNRVDPHTHRTRAPQRIAPQIIAFRAQLEQTGEHSPRVSRDAMKLPARAMDAEIWNGDVTFMGWLRGELSTSGPASWAELDAQLGALGVVRQVRRSGFVFIDRTGTRSYGVRASMVGFGPHTVGAWGPAPAPPGLPVRERLSYGELLALGALRSPLVPAHLERLRDRWIYERRHRPGTAAQFGKWVRRQVSAHDAPINGPRKGRLSSMIKDEPRWRTE